MGDPSEVSHRDKAGAFCVKEVEDVVNVFSCILLDESWRQKVNKLLEGDVSSPLCVQIKDQLIDGLVAGLRTE